MILIARWSTHVSGRDVYNDLRERGKNVALLTAHRDGRVICASRAVDAIVNFGVPVYKFSGIKYTHIINKEAAITAHKMQCFTIWKKLGVPCPEIVDPEQATRVFLARKDFLSGGRGITICHPGENYPIVDFYVDYIPTTAEYRVHVWMGKIIAVTLKTRQDRNPERSAVVIRSHRRNYVQLHRKTYPEGLAEVARKAVSALLLDFGAVDVLYDGHNFYVLEINGAPGMAPRTRSAYVGELTCLE